MKVFFFLFLTFAVSCNSESNTAIEADTSFIDFRTDDVLGNNDVNISPDLGSDLRDVGQDADMETQFSIPETEAGIQARWFIGLLNSKMTITTDDIEAHFDQAFLAEVPVSSVVSFITQLRATAPWEALRILGESDETSLSLVMKDKDGTAAVLALRTKNQKIIGARVRFTPEYGPFPKSWEELDSVTNAGAEISDILVSEIVDGTCSEVHRHSDGKAFALGSIFKLYILDSWAEGVIAGTHQWEEQVEIREEYKSFSTGDLQSLPDGSMVDARTLANAMISISDNTATDLLLRTLGRETVEVQMATTHSSPTLNIPFLSTREIFQLKIPNNTTEIESYLAMNAEERKTFLDTVLSGRGLPNPGLSPPWNSPRYINEIEWFATGDDLCEVMAKFNTLKKTDANYQIVADVLAINPGVAYEALSTQFPYVGFKGGSEPGVLTATWLLERADGRSFFVSIALNDADKQVDFQNFLGAYYGAFQLVNAIP